MSKSKEIVTMAESYIGEMEKPGNSGFKNPEFEKEMREEGWQTGWAWCAVFAKVVFKNVYPEKAKELDKLFNPSAVKTLENFRNAAYLINELPQEGSLVIWQQMKDGKPQWQGHAGICGKVTDGWIFESIEGNTNDGGGREGYIVAKRTRKTIKEVKDGLKIIGFVQI